MKLKNTWYAGKLRLHEPRLALFWSKNWVVHWVIHYWVNWRPIMWFSNSKLLKITHTFGFPTLENLWSNFIDYRPFPQIDLTWRNFNGHKFWKTTHGSGFHTLKKFHWMRARAWNHLIDWIPDLEKSDWVISQPRKYWIKFYVILDL